MNATSPAPPRPTPPAPDPDDPVPMHIVMVTPELAPVAKVGGLADVVTGLSKELRNQGHRVEIFMPMHLDLKYDEVRELRRVMGDCWSPCFDEWAAEEVYHGFVEGVDCFFFPCNGRFYRPGVYGEDDDLMRYAHFCRSVMEFLARTRRAPDILHCHDWTTALVPVLLYERFAFGGLERTRAVFTIHNILYQGECWFGEHLLASVGLDGDRLFRPDRLADDYLPDTVNLMKGAVVYSNTVTTVSPTYAWEITTVEGARGLDRVIAAHAHKVRGILNGLDTDIWDPSTDPFLPRRYDADTLDRKAANTRALRERLGMALDDRPLVACVSRLVEQKGLHLIRHAMGYAVHKGAQFVLLGASLDQSVNAEFTGLAMRIGVDGHARTLIGHDEEMAHLLYAGAHILLQPSLFEPCGLTQLIGLRYGAVPVVRRTGGLADTVFDVDDESIPREQRNGYVFDHPDAAAVSWALERAVDRWNDAPREHEALVLNGMKQDFSWARSAREYAKIYGFLSAH